MLNTELLCYVSKEYILRAFPCIHLVNDSKAKATLLKTVPTKPGKEENMDAEIGSTKVERKG